MKDFKVSVIIPVYNAEKFLSHAVNSAMSLAEVGEVLLVDDGSVDGSLNLCQQMAAQNAKVKVLRHAGNGNRGAGASRNLGIAKSQYDYVAFLDADDWYLPNRFEREASLFNDSTIDGVYGATGFYYEDSQTLDSNRLTTISKPTTSAHLLENLLRADTGRFHTNAITIRKRLFQTTGLFDTSLRLHQDTHLWLRLAHFGKLVPGITDKPISIRRVHTKNRIQFKNTSSRHLLYKKTFESFHGYNNVPSPVLLMILKKYIASYSNNTFKRVLFALKLLVSHPSIIKLFTA